MSLAGIVFIWHSVRFPVLFAAITLVIGLKLWGSLKSLQTHEIAHIGEKRGLHIPRPGPSTETRLSSQIPRYNSTSVGKLPLRRSSPKRVTGGTVKGRVIGIGRKKGPLEPGPEFDSIQPIIFYASLTTTTSQLAELLHKSLFSSPHSTAYPTFSVPTSSTSPPSIGSLPRRILPPLLYDLESIELDDYFTTLPTGPTPTTKLIYLVLLPAYDPPQQSPSHAFLEHLADTHHDFRIETSPLRNLGGFSVFGVGDSSEWGDDKRFCRDAKLADKWLGKLTGGIAGAHSRRIFPIGFGDCNPLSEGKGDVDSALKCWTAHLEEAVKDYALTGELEETAEIRAAVESEDEDSDVDAESGDVGADGEPMVDVEDIGKMIAKERQSGKPNSRGVIAVDFTTKGKADPSHAEPKEMVPKGGPTYNALTKQGYDIVGSHSGVKVLLTTL